MVTQLAGNAMHKPSCGSVVLYALGRALRKQTFTLNNRPFSVWRICLRAARLGAIRREPRIRGARRACARARKGLF